MGCCASTPSAGGADVPAGRAPSSSRNITAPSTRRASHASQPDAPPQTIAHRPNLPLKAVPADQRSPLPTARVRPLTDPSNTTWTPSRLEQERIDWWDTQVTGTPEVWAAIRVAVQSLQAGEVQTAQALLDVTGCTCPTGLLWRGVYDATGVQYRVPEWVIVQPEGLAEEPEAGVGTSFTPAAQMDAVNAEHAGELVKIKVRTSHDQSDVEVSIGKKEVVCHIVKRIQTQAQLQPNTNLRLAYRGRLYQPHETLESNQYWNFDNAHVLTALVTP